MEEDNRQKIKKAATVLVWVIIVAWACYFFYEKELAIGRALPMVLAAQSLDVEQLSYIYEGDIDEIFGQNVDKEKIENNISVYMYENNKTGDWGRIIIYDRATTSFKYVIKTKNGSRAAGEAVYDNKLKEYVNTSTGDSNTDEGCKINLKVKNENKISYSVKDISNINSIDNADKIKCNDHSSDPSKNNFLINVIHKLI